MGSVFFTMPLLRSALVDVLVVGLQFGGVAVQQATGEGPLTRSCSSNTV